MSQLWAIPQLADSVEGSVGSEFDWSEWPGASNGRSVFSSVDAVIRSTSHATMVLETVPSLIKLSESSDCFHERIIVTAVITRRVCALF